MAYTGFPATYQPMYYPQYQQQTQQQNNSIIWVSGEAGAKSYLTAPNTTVVLFDSEASVVYIKSADASGMPSIKTLDYTIRETSQNSPNTGFNSQTNNLSNYATKDEITAITGEIATLKEQLAKLAKKRRDEDDE